MLKVKENKRKIEEATSRGNRARPSVVLRGPTETLPTETWAELENKLIV